MECDIYARIECKTEEQFDFCVMMLNTNHETLTQIQPKAELDLNLFELCKDNNNLQGLNYTKSSLVIEVHFLYEDMATARKQLAGFARAGFETCYALLWLDIGEFVLLCAQDEEVSFHTEKWHGHTWHKLNQQQHDVIDILNEIAHEGGVFEKGEKPLTEDQLNSFSTLLGKNHYQSTSDKEIETINDLLISCWNDDNKHCYYVPIDDFNLDDLDEVREQYATVVFGLAEAAGLDRNIVSIRWHDSDWGEGELSIDLSINGEVTRIDWAQEDDWVDGSFVFPVASKIQSTSSGEFVDLDDGYGFDHRLLHLVNEVAEQYRLLL